MITMPDVKKKAGPKACLMHYQFYAGKNYPIIPANSKLFFFNFLISTSSIIGSGERINDVLFSFHHVLFFSSIKGNTPTKYFLSLSACHSSIHSKRSLGMYLRSSKLTYTFI